MRDHRGNGKIERLISTINERLRINKNIILKGVLEQDSRATFAASDFEEDTDSTILVRERARGSKLEPAFSKRRGRVPEETEYTITFLPQGKRRIPN